MSSHEYIESGLNSEELLILEKETDKVAFSDEKVDIVEIERTRIDKNIKPVYLDDENVKIEPCNPVGFELVIQNDFIEEDYKNIKIENEPIPDENERIKMEDGDFKIHSANEVSGDDSRMDSNYRDERNVWSFVDLENLSVGEVDALLAEIASDGESIEEFGDEHEEEDFVAPMVFDYANMEEITVASMDTEVSMNGFSVVPIQNSSDPVDDEEDDIPLSHFVPIDKFIWKKPSTITNIAHYYNVTNLGRTCRLPRRHRQR
ncbi:hypothetical protein JTB14_009611 [Gonioctena quinquepunctata]|nr:hypothetical protein JTB14_009611 [Gonioctena quinquepunctata]